MSVGRTLVRSLIIIALLSMTAISFAEQSYKKPFYSKRAGRFTTGGLKTFPTFYKELVIDPFKVKQGEKQSFSIWAKDPEGITKATATIKTDKGEKKLRLKLVEGTRQDGRWTCFWRTKNISKRDTYTTQFKAFNKKGKDAKTTCFWHTSKEK